MWPLQRCKPRCGAPGPTIVLGTFHIARVGNFEALSFQCLIAAFPLMNSPSRIYCGNLSCIGVSWASKCLGSSPELCPLMCYICRADRIISEACSISENVMYPGQGIPLNIDFCASLDWFQFPLRGSGRWLPFIREIRGLELLTVLDLPVIPCRATHWIMHCSQLGWAPFKFTEILDSNNSQSLVPFRPIESKSLEIPRWAAQHFDILSRVRPDVLHSLF